MCDIPYKYYWDGLQLAKNYVDNLNGASIGPFYKRAIKNKHPVL